MIHLLFAFSPNPPLHSRLIHNTTALQPPIPTPSFPQLQTPNRKRCSSVPNPPQVEPEHSVSSSRDSQTQRGDNRLQYSPSVPFREVRAQHAMVPTLTGMADAPIEPGARTPTYREPAPCHDTSVGAGQSQPGQSSHATRGPTP